MIGNDTILGQIASFIDALHLSYEEVVYKIPYPTLLLMQRDKLRPCTGVKIKPISGKEMAAHRRKNPKPSNK